MAEKKHKPDYWLVITVMVLLVIGLVILSSASAVVSYENFGNNYQYLKHQLFYGVLFGLLAMIITSRVNYRFWKKFAAILLGVTLVLLLAVFIPGIGLEYGGARRWISLGAATMQPTEVVKLTFILYLATWLEKRQKGIRDWKFGFLPFVTVLGIIGSLIMLQPDLGTMSVIIVSAIAIYFIAGARWRHLAAIGGAGVVLFWILIKAAPYRMARFTVFLNPELDPQGIGYQINQALLAVGSGGLFGRGLGKSIQKYNYLPEATGDSIFAVMAEELGFIRILFLIGAFVFLAIRGFLLAKRAPDLFGKLVAVGIISWIAFQAFINIAAMVALVPLTGIPLPFISYGGTALLFTLAAVGILINISQYTKTAQGLSVDRRIRRNIGGEREK
ncbi:MAG: putative lipid II flippase FtsW [Parcubacteria group bacterium]|nr:putative lipid II flippase FtsW [Parcubacteria group bacterium]